jgi:O-antigen/teichoic acid export membrane protein
MREVQEPMACGVTVSSAAETTASFAAKTQPGGLSLRRNAGWMLLGQGAYAVGQWAIVIIVARLGGPALIGQLTLALAITAPIFVFGYLQMREIQVVDTRGRYDFTDYRAVRLGTMALALLATAAVAVLAGYPTVIATVILAVGLTRAIGGLSDIYYGLVQRHERLDRVAQSMLARTVIGCAALGFALVLTGSLVAALLAQAAAWAAVWWLFDRRVAKPWRGIGAAHRADGSRTLRGRLWLAWLGLPLGGALMLNTLNANVPRYAIGGFLDVDALGIFAALGHFVVAGNTVLHSVGHAAIPRLAKLFAERRIAAYCMLLSQFCGIGALLGLAGVLTAFWFGEPILRLVYGEPFSSHADLLVLIMLANTIWYASMPLGVHSLSAMHRFRIQPAIQGAGVVVNAAACLILVPHYGINGAVGAWALALGCQGLICLIMNFVYLRRAAQGGDSGWADHSPGAQQGRAAVVTLRRADHRGFAATPYLHHGLSGQRDSKP